MNAATVATAVDSFTRRLIATVVVAAAAAAALVHPFNCLTLTINLQYHRL